MASLYDHKTGEFLREATEAELTASTEAAKNDGGCGVIEIEINGRRVSVYAMEL